MSEQIQTGLYDKYTVIKKNGDTSPEADYFVLRLDTDTHARAAALAYADSIRSENRNIAMDIYTKLMKYESKNPRLHPFNSSEVQP